MKLSKGKKTISGISIVNVKAMLGIIYLDETAPRWTDLIQTEQQGAHIATREGGVEKLGDGNAGEDKGKEKVRERWVWRWK